MIVYHRGAAVCLVVFALAWLAPPVVAVDIATSGFNEDVVMEPGGATFAHRFDGLAFCWVEQGYAGPLTMGLPVSGQFTSSSGSGIVYHLQPYTRKNVLRLGDNDPLTGSLTVAPGQYASLHLLSSEGKGFGPDNFGGYPPASIDVTLNFADGSVTVPDALHTHDWAPWNTQAPGSVPPIALEVRDRGLLASSTQGTGAAVQNYPDGGFALYETQLDLTQLGLSGRVLQSIAFTDPSPAYDGTIGIFAVDGTSAPEPGIAPLLALSLVARRRQSARMSARRQ